MVQINMCSNRKQKQKTNTNKKQSKKHHTVGTVPSQK